MNSHEIKKYRQQAARWRGEEAVAQGGEDTVVGGPGAADWTKRPGSSGAGSGSGNYHSNGAKEETAQIPPGVGIAGEQYPGSSVLDACLSSGA